MFKCFEGENTSMCEAIRQMVDEGMPWGSNYCCNNADKTEN